MVKSQLGKILQSGLDNKDKIRIPIKKFLNHFTIKSYKFTKNKNES